MNNELKTKQPLPLWRRIVLWLICAAIIMLIGVMAAGYIMGKKLGSEIVKIKEANEPLTFSDWWTNITAKNASNAAESYYAGAISNVSTNDIAGLAKINVFYLNSLASGAPDQFPADMRKQISQILTAFQPVFDKLDRAASLPLAYFNIGIDGGMKKSQGALEQISTIFWVSSMRTLDQISNNKGDDAANSLVSMLKMLRIFDSTPTMFITAAKREFTIIACEETRLLLERTKLSENSLIKLQKTLAEVMPPDILHKMFLCERVRQIEIGANLVPQDVYDKFLKNVVPEQPERLLLPGTQWARFRIRQKSIQYFKDVAELITASQRDWPGPLDLTQRYISQTPQKSNRFVSTGAAFIRINAETHAIVRSIMLAVALKRYQIDFGKPPDSIDKLVPKYIDIIPLDPFTGKPLLYKQNPKGYTIYSTSDDREDDGGLMNLTAGEKIPKDIGIYVNLETQKSPTPGK